MAAGCGWWPLLHSAPNPSVNTPVRVSSVTTPEPSVLSVISVIISTPVQSRVVVVGVTGVPQPAGSQ